MEPGINSPSEKSRLLRFFSKPIVGITGSVASVVGVGLAVLFYFSEQKSRDLTAFVHPVKATVVKAGQASRLSVRLNEIEITNDVTAVQIALWNRGVLSVRRENILKPIVIKLPGCRILEASIRKQSRDVVNMSLGAAKINEGRLGVSWDILEKSDGGIMQIVYAGGDSSAIEFEGVIEGQPALSLLQYSGKLTRLEEQYSNEARARPRLGWWCTGFGLLMFVLTAASLLGEGGMRALAEGRFGRIRRVMILFQLLTTLAMPIMGIYLLLIPKVIGPPFGF
jgi:hypothetical protein